MERRYELATIDLLILAGYALGILLIGFFVGRKKKSAEGYFLADRGSSWFRVGFALMAANLSGTSYIGLAGAGYEDGIAVWNYEWMATLVLTFFALTVLPFYLRSEVKTVPEFLERRYDRRARFAFSGFTVFTAMFIDASGAMFAGAVALRLLFPGVPLWMLIAAVALLGGLYVLLGGLSAVMITDTIQGILLLSAGAVLFLLVFREVGSWSAVQQVAPENGLTVFKPPGDDFLPWPGLFTGVLWLGLYYWITNHVVVQKVLSAKDVDNGRLGALFCGLLQLPLLFFLILPGTMGRAIYPDLPSPDMVWPALAFEFLPVGLRGLVLAALVAALMSTLDSVLNGTSSLVTQDFVQTLKPHLSQRKLLVIGRALVFGFMVVAAVWAPQIAHFPTIVEYFQAFLGHLTMPVVTVFLGGLFWRRATAQAAFLTLIVGVPIGLAAFVAGELLELYQLQFLYATGLMMALSVALFTTASLLTPAPDGAGLEGLTWSRALWREESEELSKKPWWRNHRYLGAGLVTLTACLIAVFA